MVLFYVNLYVFISYGNERIFQLFGELYLFTSDGIYMFLFHVETNAFFNYLENYIYLHLMESICFYFMWKQTHFPSRDRKS